MNVRFLFILILVSNLATAQSDLSHQLTSNNWLNDKHNSVYVELLGGTSVYSLNYQRITASTSPIAFTYRVSASYLPGFTTLTGYLGSVLGKPKRSVEILLGAGYYGIKNADPDKVNFPEEEKNHNFYLTPQLGYRSQSNKRVVFRATLTP